MLIHIQRGKAGRDRHVPLSPTLLATLRAYYRWMRSTRWLVPFVPGVALAGSLAFVIAAVASERTKQRTVPGTARDLLARLPADPAEHVRDA